MKPYLPVTICLIMSLILSPGNSAGATSQPVLSTVSVGSVPRGVAVDPKSGLIYLVMYLNGSTLAIESSSLRVVGSIRTPSPYAVAINSATHRVYVSEEDGSSIVVIDEVVGSTVSQIQGAGTPYALAVDEVRNLVFAADTASNSLWIVNGSSDGVVARVPMGDTSALASDPSTGRIFVGNLSSDFRTGTVDVVDEGGGSHAILRTVTVPIPIDRFAFDPSSHLLFVSSGSGGGPSNLLAIDGTTLQVAYALHLGDAPDIMSVSPSSSSIYVSDPGTGRIYGLDERTGHLTLNYSVGSQGNLSLTGTITSMALNPATGKLYITEREVTDLIILDLGIAPPPGNPFSPIVLAGVSLLVVAGAVVAYLTRVRRAHVRKTG